MLCPYPGTERSRCSVNGVFIVLIFNDSTLFFGLTGKCFFVMLDFFNKPYSV